MNVAEHINSRCSGHSDAVSSEQSKLSHTQCFQCIWECFSHRAHICKLVYQNQRKEIFQIWIFKKKHLPQGIAKNKKHDTSEHAENLCRQFGVQYKNLIENETLITKKIRHRKLNRYILNKQREKYSSMGVTCFRQTMRHTLGCFPKFWWPQNFNRKHSTRSCIFLFF